LDEPSPVIVMGQGDDAPRPSGLVVVGVARSGTSVATRFAMSLGLHGPTGYDLFPPDAWNPDGYWESRSMAIFNERLLHRWGSTWAAPAPRVTPAMMAEAEPAVGFAAAAFAAAFPVSPWVWKDPRLTVVLPFWERVFGRQPVLFAYRDPREVARSTSARDPLSVPQSLAMWERNTRLALAALSGRRVLVASYARLCDDPAGWLAQVASFCLDAGLPVAVTSDPIPDLRTPRPTPTELSLSADQAWLFDLVRSLDGAHPELPRPDLPPEPESVGRTLDMVRWPRPDGG
jgi:hypothetical protein